MLNGPPPAAGPLAGPAPASPLLRVGPYALTHALGAGGMGQVWAARHVELGLPVALKAMHPRCAEDPWFLQAFRREVRAVALLDSPHVVRLLDHGQVEAELPGLDPAEIGPGSPWLAMELLDGEPLTRRKGRVSWAELHELLLQLLSGLGHAHARGVLHRDIKPANVLRCGNRAVLVDFGLALPLQTGADEDGAVVGTAAYMAPEQFSGVAADLGPWTDLYSLGCLGWCLLTGAPPFGQRRPTAELALDHQTRPLPPLRPSALLPDGAEALLRRLLAKSPGDRFRFAADAAEALREVGAAVRGPGAPPPPGAPGGPGAPAVSVGRARGLPARWPAPSAGEGPAFAGAQLRLFGLRRPPLVGRAAEQARLWERLGEVAGGASRALVLQGPPGTGKSALAQWLVEAAHEVGAAVPLRVSHAEVPGPGDGLGAAIGRALGLRAGDPLAQDARLIDLIGRWGLSEAEARGLRALVQPGRRAGFGAVGERHAALAAALGRLAGGRPLLLWLDDVQWGADALAAALQLLHRSEDGPPLLVLATAREQLPGTVPAALLDRLLATPGAERVELGPLAPAWRQRLVQGLLRLEPGVAAAVEDRTAGNPLFMVQLVEDWVRRGLLVPAGGGLALRPGVDPGLPADLHEVWRARVSGALPRRRSAERRALLLAAVLGVAVDPGEWRDAAALAGAEPSAELLDDLLAAGLVWPLGPDPDEGFTFAHAMLRESLLRQAEAEGCLPALHRAAAEMLARRDHPLAALRLGAHRLALGDAAGAVGPLAVGAWARVVASEYLQAEQALAERDAALRACGAPPDDPRWGEGWLMMARVARRRGELDRARALAERLNAAAVAHGWTALRAQAHRELLRHAEREGRLRDAFAHAQAAVDAARQDGAPVPLAWARADLGLLQVAAGARLTRADPALAGAQALFDEVGEVYGAATCALARAVLARREGRPADLLLRAARGGFRHSLARQEPAHGLMGLGDVAAQKGDAAGAARLYARAAARFDELGHPGPDRLPARRVAALVAAGQRPAARAAWPGVPAAGALAQLGAAVELLLSAPGADAPAQDRALAALAAADAPDPEALELLERALSPADRGPRPAALRAALSAAWARLGWPARSRAVRGTTDPGDDPTEGPTPAGRSGHGLLQQEHRGPGAGGGHEGGGQQGAEGPGGEAQHRGGDHADHGAGA